MRSEDKDSNSAFVSKISSRPPRGGGSLLFENLMSSSQHMGMSLACAPNVLLVVRSLEFPISLFYVILKDR